MEASDATSTDLLDTHCHLDLYPDPVALVKRLDALRIHTIAVTNAPSLFWHTRDISNGSSYIHAAVGLHPELVATHGREVDSMWPLLEQTRFVGEVGLDYVTGDSALRQSQRRVFESILERCAGYGNKILTVHSRRSAGDVVTAIGVAFPGKVILHWFTGSVRELDRAIANGYYFSLNAAMVGAKSGQMMLARMPPDRVLTETDGPFVKTANVPARPGEVEQVIKALSRSWRTSPEDARLRVATNFSELCR